MIKRIAKSLLPYLTVAFLTISLGCGPAFAGTDELRDFEAALKENFPGSYMLYASLSGDSQQRVITSYSIHYTKLYDIECQATVCNVA